MEGPHIPHRIRDRSRKVTFVVMAYRQLALEETLQIIALHLRQQRRKPKANTVVTILTSIGAET